MSSFHNAPESNSHTIGRQINGKTVIFEFKTEAHHIYAQNVFGDSSALQAMQREGLWHGNDFRVNGLQLPSEMRFLGSGPQGAQVKVV